MRNIEIIGFGTYLPQNTITFNDQTRYRAIRGGDETQLSMAVASAKRALDSAHLSIEDIDMIVSSSAVGIQPIPCNAALIHEQIAKGTDIPAMDINTTCTSFVTAFDTVSYFIEAGRYKRVLIVASDLSSAGLNPNQKESYELFSDAAASIIVEKSKNPETGILYSLQKTWSEGAHSTEIRGGLTAMLPDLYHEETKEDYMFDMKGIQVLRLATQKLPILFKQFYTESNLTLDDIQVVVPHQASKALGMVMQKLHIPQEKYVDYVSQYGNMVSAAIPVALCTAIETGRIKKGDVVLLCGTAAGLTANLLVFRY